MSELVTKVGSPRVLCVSSFFAAHGGGVERVAHELAEHLACERGWDVTLAAHGVPEEVPQGASYDVFALQGWNRLEKLTGLPLVMPSLTGLARLLGVCRRADLVAIHDEIYLSGFVALIWCMIIRRPVVVIKHTGILPFPQKSLQTFHRLLITLVFRPLLKFSALVVFVTAAKRSRYDPGNRLRNAVIIANGIDIDLFRRDATVARDRQQICFVGRFIDRKGIFVLRELVKRMPGTQFTLVGWGPEDPRTWNLPNVTVEWNPARAAVARNFQRAQLSLFPGVSEGVALVVLESLSCGTRVLLNADCDVPDPALQEALEFEPVDLERPEETAARWQTRIQRLLDAPPTESECRSLSSLVAERYSRFAVGERYADAFQSIIRSRTEPRRDGAL